MRVEFVSPYDHSPKTGIGRYLHTLVRYLSESIDVAIHRPHFLPLADRVSPLRNLPIGIQDHMAGNIVHFPQIMGCAMMLYRPYHPSVATVHDLGVLEIPEEWAMLDPVARQMLRLSLMGLKRVDRIVADSEFTRQGITQHLGIPGKRVVTIYPGVDHELFRPIADARDLLIAHYPSLAAIASAPWLLYVGSELPRKNIGTLLRAVTLVREEIPDVRLIKVGPAGGERFRRETLGAIGELGLEDHVLIFEGVDEGVLPHFYNAADAFVTASKLEGFGFPVLEAMACGTPVVCSHAGSLPEMAGDAALYSPPDKPGAMGRLLTQVLSDRESSSVLRSMAIRHSAAFRWEEGVTELINIYQSVSTLSRPHA